MGADASENFKFPSICGRNGLMLKVTLCGLCFVYALGKVSGLWPCWLMAIELFFSLNSLARLESNAKFDEYSCSCRKERAKGDCAFIRVGTYIPLKIKNRM